MRTAAIELSSPRMAMMKPAPAGTAAAGLPPAAKKLSISILVISLPVLYVSLLHVPPSTLFKDTAFWFLMSNSLILIVAADSGIFSSSASAADDLHDEYIRYIRSSSSSSPAAVLVVSPPADTAENHCSEKDNTERLLPAAEQPQDMPAPAPTVERSLSAKETISDEKMAIVLHEDRPTSPDEEQASPPPLKRSVTEKRMECRAAEEGEYSSLSDEELNRRVEEFIRRFNREIRQQSREELMN